MMSMRIKTYFGTCWSLRLTPKFTKACGDFTSGQYQVDLILNTSISVFWGCAWSKLGLSSC